MSAEPERNERAHAGPEARGVGEARGEIEARDELERVTHAWDAAMRTNDPAAIARFMHEDWTIVGPDGSVDGRDTFVALVESGALTHDVMESHDLDIRIYGDAAVVICRGISGGEYRGSSFHVVERVTSVFVRADDAWTCVATHLSRLDDAD